MRLFNKVFKKVFNRGFIPNYLETTDRKGKTWYILLEVIKWHDKKLNKYITVPKYYISDGASGAIDIKSKGWWVHDWLCEENGFDDGTECSNWHASRILSGILFKEKRPLRSFYWRVSTFLLGGERLNKF